MSRLIDADALKATMIGTLEQIKANPKMDGQEMHIIAGIAMLGEMIDDSPTIDAVPVVRCRECKRWSKHPEGYLGACSFISRNFVMKNRYCAWGERKEDDHE